MFFWKYLPIDQFFDHISGTGSRRHDSFTLNPWPYFSFQTSPGLSRSVQSLPRKSVSLIEVDLKITFPVISPEPEVAVMIHLPLICSHISACKRAQDCSNRFSHLREKDVSLVEIGLEVTFSIITPEPGVAATIPLHLINAPIVPFE